MKTKYIVLLLWSILASWTARTQVDTFDLTFPYYYPCYQMQGYIIYDSAAMCGMQFCYSDFFSVCSEVHRGHSGSLSDYWGFSYYRNYTNNAYIGYIAENDMDILGISQPFPKFAEDLSRAEAQSSFIDFSFSSTFPFPGIMVLGTPYGDAVQMQRYFIFNLNDVVRNRMLKLRTNWGGIDNGYRYCPLMEYLFEVPFHINAGDTFYLSAGRVDTTNHNPDNIIFKEQLWAPWEEHIDPYNPEYNELHFPELLYRVKDTAGWHSGTFHILPFLWAIVRFPGDTCPEPQGLRATWLADNVALLQFDTMSNHAVWEVCYGPAGTAPGGGTVVETTIPQAVLSGLDPDLHYTVYVRARCDFAYSEWTAWSAPLDICMAELGIAEWGTSALGLRLSPNPAKGSVKVECDVPLEEVSISDASGRTVLHQKAQGATELTLDIHQLSPGVYTLLSATKSGLVARKLAVQ